MSRNERLPMPQEDAASDPKGVTGQLATWLATLESGQVPGRVRTRASHLLLDGIACALVGAQLPWSRIAVEAITPLEGSGDTPLLGWGRGVPPPTACLLNGTFIQGFELDDYHPAAPLHSLSLVLPSALATLDIMGKSGTHPRTGREFLTALIAGFEVGPRVGMGLHGGEMLSRGWHSGAVFGTHAAAATAGYLRGLSPKRFEDALGLAATQSGGLMAAQYEAMSKRMHHGLAARAGFTSAGLADYGYTGIKRVFEREYGGFLSTFGEGRDPDPTAIVDALGERWETEAIAVKAYAAMAATHAPIDCALQLRGAGLGPNDIEHLDIWVSRAAYHHGWWVPEQPLETIGAQMNIGYAVAAALLDGQVLAEQFTRQRVNAADIWSLLARISVHHDSTFDTPDGRFRTRMVARTSAGAEETVTVDGPHGGDGRPLSNEEIETKARALLAGVTTPEATDRLVDLALGVDDLGDLSPLTELLAAPVRAVDIEL